MCATLLNRKQTREERSKHRRDTSAFGRDRREMKKINESRREQSIGKKEKQNNKICNSLELKGNKYY